MPTAHTRYSFTFDELSDQAKATAVESIAEKLGGDWWDSDDIERVSRTIVYKLGEVLTSPGWDTFGEGDFPGVAGVTLDGWDIERGQHVALNGDLTRENAPSLPWADGVASISLTALRHGTLVSAAHADVAFICAQCGQESVWEAAFTGPGLHHTIDVSGGTIDDEVSDADHVPTFPGGLPDLEARCETVKDAVRDAMSAALTAGRAEADYIGSAENAQEWIDSNAPAFNEDGTVF